MDHVDDLAEPEPEPEPGAGAAHGAASVVDGSDEIIETTEPIEPSSAIGQFRQNTVAGAILGGVAIGLRDIFDPVVREEAPIVQDWAGDPPRPRPIDVDLDPDDPSASSVLVRPHLLPPTEPLSATDEEPLT